MAKWNDDLELDGGRWVPKASSRPAPRAPDPDRHREYMAWWRKAHLDHLSNRAVTEVVFAMLVLLAWVLLIVFGFAILPNMMQP